MKTIHHYLLLLGLLSGFTHANAQGFQPLIAPDNGSYQSSEYHLSVDQTLLNLDLGPVRSQVLYDRVFPAARLFDWDQNDESSQGHFIQAQREIYEASYNKSNKLRPDNFHWMP